ncbi:hypothetical protein [Burkholderia cepacia]|uniref:hypothetical protein n=1 Tax=Burkholderia cepacia TaxID=292 RepID=UPI000AA6D138|nr:hypothetical protein [Burkholderia cepacia]
MLRSIPALFEFQMFGARFAPRRFGTFAGRLRLNSAFVDLQIVEPKLELLYLDHT